MQEPTPPYEDILEDETLAPLKRNHACLQCKKRKVKCDAVRPTCNPCMRSHAHALRSAQRNKSRPPPLVCSYTEGDEEELPDDAGIVVDAERKRSSAASVAGGAKRAAVGDKMGRERDRRAVEDKDTLKARIAELEARIAALTTNDTAATGQKQFPTPESSIAGFTSTNPTNNWNMPMNAFPVPPPTLNSEPSYDAPFLSVETGAPGQFQSFDFSNLLIMPNHWPKNLPSPAVLEHLIDTFYQCEPQFSRIVHRGTLLARLKMPPTGDGFPFAGLLHAICAAAAPHTAWTSSRAPAELEDLRNRHIKLGMDLELSEDFASAQTEAAERCIRHGTVMCMMGGGQFVFDVTRAQLILTISYLNQGMALRAWMVSGSPARLIKLLEITNRNRRKTDKPAMMSPPKTDVEREERLATVWVAFLLDSCFSANSAWAPSLDLDDIRVPLPASSDEFLQKFDNSGYVKPNPQTAHDPDLLVNHPVPDQFVFVVKSTILLARVAKWIREWQQRVIQPGDEMKGFQSPSFVKLNGEIASFQMSLPASLKNIYRLVDAGGNSTFNAELISIHLYPNLSLLLLHELFVDWKGPETPSLRQMQTAFEAVVGFIHLVPSQMDVSHMINPLIAFSLFNVGKMVNRFIIRAKEQEQYALAMRWNTDLMAVVNLLERYGAKHALGHHLVQFLSNYQKLYESGVLLELECGGGDANYNTPTHNVASACEVTESSTRSSAASASGGTTSASPAVNSVGQTPDSSINTDSMDGRAFGTGSRNGNGVGSGMGAGAFSGAGGGAMSNGFGDATLPVFGSQTSPTFDPSLLDFLDPLAAAQVSAALDSASKDPNYLPDLFAGLTDTTSFNWNTQPGS